jgi:hypothetical protein
MRRLIPLFCSQRRFLFCRPQVAFENFNFMSPPAGRGRRKAQENQSSPRRGGSVTGLWRLIEHLVSQG